MTATMKRREPHFGRAYNNWIGLAVAIAIAWATGISRAAGWLDTSE